MIQRFRARVVLVVPWLTAMLLLGLAVRSQAAQSGPAGKTRTYYVAADEVNWDYAPSGRDEAMGMPFDDIAKVYTESGPHRIGRVYKKAIYREYTDATFSTLKVRPPEEQYLGLLGPVLRGEVGDTIKVVFKNNASHPYSMHPHGVLYQKDSEGADYNDGTSGADKDDGGVPPGATHIYVWQIPERAGPGPNDPSSIFWLYHSHADELRDVASGLFGVIVVTRRGMALPDGRPKDVDREFVSMFIAINENESWYLEDNIRDHTTDPKGVDRTTVSSHHSRRNGRNDCRDGLRRRQHQVVHQRLHLRKHADDDDEARRPGALVRRDARRLQQRAHAPLARQYGARHGSTHGRFGCDLRANGDCGHGARCARNLALPLPH